MSTWSESPRASVPSLRPLLQAAPQGFAEDPHPPSLPTTIKFLPASEIPGRMCWNTTAPPHPILTRQRAVGLGVSISDGFPTAGDPGTAVRTTGLGHSRSPTLKLPHPIIHVTASSWPRRSRIRLTLTERTARPRGPVASLSLFPARRPHSHSHAIWGSGLRRCLRQSNGNSRRAEVVPVGPAVSRVSRTMPGTQQELTQHL